VENLPSQHLSVLFAGRRTASRLTSFLAVDRSGVSAMQPHSTRRKHRCLVVHGFYCGNHRSVHAVTVSPSPHRLLYSPKKRVTKAGRVQTVQQLELEISRLEAYGASLNCCTIQVRDVTIIPTGCKPSHGTHAEFDDKGESLTMCLAQQGHSKFQPQGNGLAQPWQQLDCWAASPTCLLGVHVSSGHTVQCLATPATEQLATLNCTGGAHL
jgi:hypothetical protein